MRETLCVKNVLVMSPLLVIVKMLGNNILDPVGDDVHLLHCALFRQSHSMAHTMDLQNDKLGPLPTFAFHCRFCVHLLNIAL